MCKQLYLRQFKRLKHLMLKSIAKLYQLYVFNGVSAIFIEL
jgi:hypothetical protein